METDAQQITLVDHHKLTRFVATAFEKLGVPSPDAAIAADALVMADLRGVDTHGVIRFDRRGPWNRHGDWPSRNGIGNRESQTFGRRHGRSLQQPALRHVGILCDASLTG